MSFSLHTGKACEGPIGSEFKVDAIYVSKEVQVGTRIDQLCDLYNREILLTDAIYSMLSDRAKELTRKIETITMNECPKQSIVSLKFRANLACRMYTAVTFIQVIRSRASKRLNSLRLVLS